MRKYLPIVIIGLAIFAFVNIYFISNTSSPELTFIQGSEPAPAPAEPQQVVIEGLMLPDMKIEPPEELYITTESGVKKIRFDTTFTNIGAGPLELIGEADEEREVTVATQRIYKDDGSAEERIVGEFVYHPGHKHWHVDRYANFQLFAYDRARGPKELVTQTDKFSFCIWDEHVQDLSVPGAPRSRVYLRCVNNIQGNSVGWGDTYTANLEGQEIDITGVPDGDYMVRSVVNADNKILESDYSNNEVLLYVQISGNTIKIVENITNGG